MLRDEYLQKAEIRKIVVHIKAWGSVTVHATPDGDRGWTLSVQSQFKIDRIQECCKGVLEITCRYFPNQIWRSSRKQLAKLLCFSGF